MNGAMNNAIVGITRVNFTGSSHYICNGCSDINNLNTINVLHQNKNGEVLIVTLRRKPNRFEPDAWLGLLYYFMHFHCIYTLKCSFQSAGRFIAARLTTPLLF